MGTGVAQVPVVEPLVFLAPCDALKEVTALGWATCLFRRDASYPRDAKCH